MNNLKIYVDGVEKESQPWSIAQGTNGRPMEMGYSWGESRYFSGLIDQAALYNYALDANTIKQHAGVAPEPVSSALFLLGGGALVVRRFRRKK